MALSQIPDREYRSLPALSQSSIVQSLSLSGSQWLDRQTTPIEPTQRMLLGTLIHAMALEPETVSDRFCRMPKIDRRKAESKLLLEQIATDNRIVIPEGDFDLAQNIVTALNKTPAYNALFADGVAEIACHGHEIDGHAVKGKIDYLRLDKRIIIDLKTTSEELTDEALGWLMDQKSFKVQAAFYIDLLSMEAVGDWAFCFYFVNTKEPFEMRKVVVSDALNRDWLDEGRELYTQGMSLIESWKNNQFYPKLIDLPAFVPQSKPWRKKS